MDEILTLGLMDETDLDFPALMDESMAYQGSESQEIAGSSNFKKPSAKFLDYVREEAWPSFKPCLLEKFYWGVPLLRSSEVEIAPAQSQLSLRDDFLHSENGVYSLYSENGDYSLHSKNGTGTIGRVRLPNQGPFKCIMLGDGGTGKTTYVKRHLTGEFEEKYEPTMGMHEHMLDVPTKQGSTRFLCVDTPGHEKPGTPRDSYYEGADCGIIFYDITAKQTQMDVPMWYDDLYRVCGDIPIVVCGNKMDLKRRQVKTKKVPFHVKKKLQYYEISAKSGYNLDKPFQHLAQKLAGYVEGANCI